MTESELIEAAVDAETRGNALIDLGAKFRAAAKAFALVSKTEQPVTIHRYKRTAEYSMTQGDACEAAIKSLGQPRSMEEIAEFILSRGLPVKTTEAKNYGPVMSRDKRFKSFGMNKWGLVQPELNAPFAPTHTGIEWIDPSKEASNGSESPSKASPSLRI